MPLYHFIALSPRGRKIRGKSPARSPEELMKIISRNRMELVELKEIPDTPRLHILELPYLLMDSLEKLFRTLLGSHRTSVDPYMKRYRSDPKHDVLERIDPGNPENLPKFSYVAKNLRGRRVRGELHAHDQQELFNRLLLLDLHLEHAQLGTFPLPWYRRFVKKFTAAFFR